MTDITTRGRYQNQLSDLPNLDAYDFENIFKICFDPDKAAYYYNLIKTVNIPNNIADELYMFHTIDTHQPLTALSHAMYGTIKLWWLICITNNIQNPVEFIPGGSAVKVIKPRYVPYVVDLIKQSLVD